METFLLKFQVTRPDVFKETGAETCSFLKMNNSLWALSVSDFPSPTCNSLRVPVNLYCL